MGKRHHNQPKVNLRPSEAADSGFLKEVFSGTRPNIMENPLFGVREKEEFINMQFNLQDVHYRNNYPGAEFMIISEGGRNVGRLYIHEGDEDVRIMDIALLPSFRGRGTGSLIIKGLQSDAANSGKTLSIHVEENNPAKSLYHRLGFEEKGEKINGVYQLMVWCPK